MTSTVAPRRLAHRLVPVLGLLLLVAPFVIGIHHHDDGGDHVCAVCAGGDSPAVTTDITSPVAAPDGTERALPCRPESAQRSVRGGSASSRAPPRS